MSSDLIAEQPYNDEPRFMMLLEQLPQNEKKECTTFFNHTFICFTNEVPVKGLYYGAKVISFEENKIVTAQKCRYQSVWNLDFITTKNPQESNEYIHRFDEPQPPTTVYVVDSFLDINHAEFGGRATRGPSFNTGNKDAHGTHVAGIIGGTQFGVNKNARIVGIQVLDDNARGSWSTIIKGMEYVASQSPSIVNLSIAGGRSQIVNQAVQLMKDRGWKIVISAGNNAQDACNFSPGSAAGAVNVGATTSKNVLASFSNYGRCVDILAPGDGIVSAIPNNRYAYMSGTSMAAPMVAGVWSLFPNYNEDDIKSVSLSGIIRKLPRDTPNLFLNQPNKESCFHSQKILFQ